MNTNLTSSDNLDQREALFNQGEIGAITAVQLTKSEVTSLKGIMLDVDPHLINSDLFPEIAASGQFCQLVKRWCQNNSTLKKAEIRMTGNGAHVLLWLDSDVVLNSTADQDEWDGVIRSVQGCLPTDPAQPGITACTRPVGSVNSKNGARVQQVVKGQPVTKAELLSLARQMVEEPFKTFCLIVFGADSLSPCPICAGEESRFTAYRYIGKCYECKNVNLQKLLEKIYVLKGGQ